jgi:hypothetical protein
MTTKELIAAGLPIDPAVEGAERATPAEDVGSPSGSRSREDGEVQSDDGEDIGDVDAGVSDLVKTKTAGPLPPLLVFGESKVTADTIREYKKAGFFPPGAGRAPLDEQIPTPRDGECVVFRDFFCFSRLLHLWAQVPLRPHLTSNSGCLFSENPSAFADFFS